MGFQIEYLHQREKVMTRARWAVLVAALLLLQFSRVQEGLAAPLWTAYLIIAAPAAYNSYAHRLMRRRYRPIYSKILLLLDGLVASAGVAVSGGLKSPAIFFYSFMVITTVRLWWLPGGLTAGLLATGVAAVITLALFPLPPAEMAWSVAIMAAPLGVLSFFLSVEFSEADRYQGELARSRERLARSEERYYLCRQVHDSLT